MYYCVGAEIKVVNIGLQYSNMFVILSMELWQENVRSQNDVSWITCLLAVVGTRHGTGSLGHGVIWVIFHVRVTGSSFWPGVRPRVFSVFEKMPKMQNVHWKCWNDNSNCRVIMIIKNSSACKYCFTHKSTFGVHYWTGSPGQLGLRVAGFPGHCRA